MLLKAPLRGVCTAYRPVICRNPYSVLQISNTRLSSSSSHDKDDLSAFTRPDAPQFRVRKAPGEDMVAYWRTLPIGVHWEATKFWSGKGRGIKQEGLRSLMRRIQYSEDFKFARESIKLLRRKKLSVEPRTIEVFLETAAKYDAVGGASFLASRTELPWRESRTVRAKSIECVLRELIHIQDVTGRSYATELAGILRRGIRPRPTLQLNAECMKIILKGLADCGQHWLVLLAAKELEHAFGVLLSEEEQNVVNQSKEFEMQRISSSSIDG